MREGADNHTMNTTTKGNTVSDTYTMTDPKAQAFTDSMLTRPIVQGTHYAATCTRKGDITLRKTAKGFVYSAKYRVTAVGYKTATFSVRMTPDGRISCRKLAR